MLKLLSSTARLTARDASSPHRTGPARFVRGFADIRSLAETAIMRGIGLEALAREAGYEEEIDLTEAAVSGALLAPVDHPDSAHVIVAGTGLTHLGSAEGRDKMHRAAASGEKLTDSMRMFLEGLEGGKPRPGAVGQQPEWFYKGDGAHLVGTGAPLAMPAFAQDGGGEEPELAGIYLIGPDGTPHRIGFCLANEFSDHVTERHNYLWLAHSKLRPAALGPELLVGDLPRDVRGSSRILRDGAVLWEKPFLTGEANMSHSIANLEHHHFKYAAFRRPGDVHVHFFGTATLSFSDGIATQPGDVFEIEAAPFTLPLRNPLVRAEPEVVTVRAVTIGIALIGLGKIAHDQHLPAIAADPDFTLVATASADGARLGGVPGFDSIDALLASGIAVDAVAVCTPPQVRHRVAATALRHGLHVLLEKPPAASLTEAAALAALADEAKVTVFAAWHSRCAAGVAEARAWLAERSITRGTISWREDVRVWHPGQLWIWQPGGLGVFDPGINALSIVTEILPGTLLLRDAELEVPSNRHAPIAARLTLETGCGAPITADFDFRQTGPQSWDIEIKTDAGTLHLARGGAELTLPDATRAGEDREYPALYAQFARLIAAGASDLDTAPFRLVADAFLRGRHLPTDPFEE